jgi:hypothetical protein
LVFIINLIVRNIVKRGNRCGDKFRFLSHCGAHSATVIMFTKIDKLKLIKLFITAKFVMGIKHRCNDGQLSDYVAVILIPPINNRYTRIIHLFNNIC